MTRAARRAAKSVEGMAWREGERVRAGAAGFRGHENSVRGAAAHGDSGRVPGGGLGQGTIDLAGETIVGLARGSGAGVVAEAVGDLLGGVCAAGGGDFGGAHVPDSDGPGEL